MTEQDKNFEPAETVNEEEFDGEEVELHINPKRLVFGLSRIGYTPASAIADIIDNSVNAQARNITVRIVKANPEGRDNRENNVDEYIIIDDGHGMDEQGIKEALVIGSTDDHYSEDTLSKFGLGLKSAAFSQGELLEVISSNGDTPFTKYSISLASISDSYKAKRTTILSTIDNKLVSEFLPNGKGTIVRIGQVRGQNHPSISSTAKELREKLGVIYYYFIKDGGLTIKLDYGESEIIEPYDVLFTDEAEENGKLDENTWDGLTVRWIKTPESIPLDVDNDIKATIEVTTLPYPPIFERETRGGQSATREKYRIEAGNYGYYIYRNKRLISWAEGFRTKNGTIIPQNQYYYPFRGRLHITSEADDAFNIDVKKASIILSNDAWKALNDISLEYKNKCKKAWERARKLNKEAQGKDVNLTANEIVRDYETPSILPGDDMTKSAETRRKQREDEISAQMRQKLIKETEERRPAGDAQSVNVEPNEAEVESTLKGDSNPASTKIFLVPSIEDNLLWEPYYDAEYGSCVRINMAHRFAKLLLDENGNNTDMLVLVQLLFLNLAEAEMYTYKNFGGTVEAARRSIQDFRRTISEYLAHMCRSLEGKLPPLGNEGSDI